MKNEQDHGASLLRVDPPASPASTEALPSREMCICAAVRLDDGLVYFGHRHHNAMAAAREHGFDGLVRQDMQGFVTTHGRFVDRATGLRLQLLANIRSARGDYNGRALFSEDLYETGIDLLGSGNQASPEQADATRRSEAPK